MLPDRARESATIWLQSILRERLSPQLVLSEMRDSWVLKVQGAEGSVRFAPRQQAFFCPRASHECAEWHPESEGWKGAHDGSLPAPGVSRLPETLLRRERAEIHFGYDLPGLVFWMLSRIEEVDPQTKDIYGRFQADASHAVRHGYIERPIVDEWLHVLRQAIELLWPQLSLYTPAFEIRLSHDVDEPSRYRFKTPIGLLRAMAGDVLRRRAPLDALLAPWIWLERNGGALHPRDPCNTFDWLMDTSERFGLRSAFYFICGRTSPDRDADYEPEHPAIRRLMREIHRRGHEIGLHPSYGAFRDPAQIASEATRLRRVCAEEEIRQETWGARMHYLRWETPTTLYALEHAGISYDASLGFAASPGFRCGTCFEYCAFDPVKQRPLPIRIRPLIAMEGSIISDRYLGLGTGEAAYRYFMRLKNACRAVRGQFTLLWHNSELQHREERELYAAVISD